MNNKEFRQRLVLACIQGAMAGNVGDEQMSTSKLVQYALTVAFEAEQQMEQLSAFRDLMEFTR